MIKRDAPALGALETYLARLDAALTALPPGERQEILLETRSHGTSGGGRGIGRMVTPRATASKATLTYTYRDFAPVRAT